jgi:hypothetical protein
MLYDAIEQCTWNIWDILTFLLFPLGTLTGGTLWKTTCYIQPIFQGEDWLPCLSMSFHFCVIFKALLQRFLRNLIDMFLFWPSCMLVTVWELESHWRDRRHTTEMTMFGTWFKRADSEFEVALRKPLMYWRQFFNSVTDSGLGVLYKEPWRSGALQESFGAGLWTCIPVCHKKGFVQSLERSILFSVFRVVQFSLLIFDLEVTWLWDDWWHNRHSN